MPNKSTRPDALKGPSKRIGYKACWFPPDSKIKELVSTLARLIEADMPIKGVKCEEHAAVTSAVEEAIARRQRKAAP